MNMNQTEPNFDHSDVISSLKGTISKFDKFINTVQENLSPEQLSELQTQAGGYKKFSSDMENVSSKLNEAMEAVNKIKF